jgi:DNA-binding transcriptional regulator YdaS (Cro superfamily)
MTSRYDLTEQQFEAAFAAFQAAVAKAPGQTAFANICRCTQGNISQLLANRSLLPERFVLKVEAATAIPREAFRPDIYPPADTSVSSPADDIAVEAGAPIVAFDRRAGMKRVAGA